MDAGVEFCMVGGEERDWVGGRSAQARGVGWLGSGWGKEVGEGRVGG